MTAQPIRDVNLDLDEKVRDGGESGSTTAETSTPPSGNADNAPGSVNLHLNDDSQARDGSPLSQPQEAAPAPAPTTPAAAQVVDEPEAGRTKLETTLVMASLCAALFLAALDVTIIATAIPTISQEFQSSAGYIWIGSAYLLANAAFVPTWGKISDIFGRKPILLCATGVFWVGSLLCGVAVNMPMLIAARAVQGVGGGGIIVLVNICISDLFSIRRRGIFFGIISIVWAVASAIGPVLGGVFTSEVSWRWCFYVNLPISGLGIIVLFFVLKLHTPKTPLREGLKAIDWTGSLTIIGGTLMLLLGLELGGVTFPWDSATILCLIIFGIVMIGLFVANEHYLAKYPVIPLRLFTKRSSLAAYSASFCHAFVFISGSYWLPLYFQAVLGVDSLMSGVYLLPYVLALSLTSIGSGFIIHRTGNYYYLIVGGLAITTLGFGLFIDLPPNKNFAKIILYQAVAGLGIGPNFQSPLIAVQTNVEPRDIASATAAFSFLRQMATSISVVIGGVVFNNKMEAQRDRLIDVLGPEVAGRLSGSSAASNVGLLDDLSGEQARVARGAYLESLQTMYIVSVVFAGVGLVLSLFIGQKKLSRNHKEHKTGLKSLKGRNEGGEGTQEETK